MSREKLFAAIRAGDVKKVNALLGVVDAKAAKANFRGSSKSIFASFSLKNSFRKSVSDVSQQPVDVNEADAYGVTALHMAMIGKGKHAIVKALLEAGADVNAAQPDGTTALHLAMFEFCKKDGGNLAVVKTLLEASANLHAKKTVYGEPKIYPAEEIWQNSDDGTKIKVKKPAYTVVGSESYTPCGIIIAKGASEIFLKQSENTNCERDEQNIKKNTRLISDLCRIHLRYAPDLYTFNEGVFDPSNKNQVTEVLFGNPNSPQSKVKFQEEMAKDYVFKHTRQEDPYTLTNYMAAEVAHYNAAKLNSELNSDSKNSSKGASEKFKVISSARPLVKDVKVNRNSSRENFLSDHSDGAEGNLVGAKINNNRNSLEGLVHTPPPLQLEDKKVGDEVREVVITKTTTISREKEVAPNSASSTSTQATSNSTSVNSKVGDKTIPLTGLEKDGESGKTTHEKRKSLTRAKTIEILKGGGSTNFGSSVLPPEFLGGGGSEKSDSSQYTETTNNKDEFEFVLKGKEEESDVDKKKGSMRSRQSVAFVKTLGLVSGRNRVGTLEEESNKKGGKDNGGPSR